MHMADALLSPAVGATMWTVTAGTIAYCSRKVRTNPDDSNVPLMGVLGALIFAAQMINFTIPATGSSGHLGGGLLLTILLGPCAAFLTISSVLTVQAFFFADGGLLALGCNIFNLGFFPTFIAYPFIYKKIAGSQPTQVKTTIAAIVAAVAGLQMGAFGVVLETVFSGISSLPFSTFVIMIQPIHFVIGIVEGLVTASVVTFVYKARPEILQNSLQTNHGGSHPTRSIVMTFLAAALLTGGILSWFASEQPDGLEWSIAKVTGKEGLGTAKGGISMALASLQKRVAILPDYTFKKPHAEKPKVAQPAAEMNKEVTRNEGGGKLGTSLSGILGGFMTLLISGLIGLMLKKRTVTD